MKKDSLLFLPVLIYFLTAGSVLAHVQLDYPVGGETFVAGENVSIKWTILIPHAQENWDIYFSSNGGNDWEEIEMDLDISRVSYLWTVPQIVTKNARIRIVQDNTGGDYEDVSGDFNIQDTPSSVDVPKNNPKSFILHANYPNPFNPKTIINYELPTTNYVVISVYNLIGQRVVTLVSEKQRAGYYSIEWNASNLSSGTYFIKMDANEFVQIIKSILVK